MTIAKKRNEQDANVRKVARARRNTEARLTARIKRLEERVTELAKRVRDTATSLAKAPRR
jgi:uncharacterized protein YlxW (UPF0749 family)